MEVLSATPVDNAVNMPGIFPLPVFPSMEILSKDSPLRELYPEDFYPNGSYFQSPFGRVRYFILGPEDGRKVVLIHGISAPSIAYKHVANDLVTRGFRVLLYDLYGRGYSEAPKITQDSTLYITQLALLFQYIGWTGAYIAGFSMGGGIAAAFAAMFPHLVEGKVVLIASAGLLERLGATKDPVILSSQDAGNFATDLRRLQSEHLPGFKFVMRSSRSDGPISGLSWAFEALATLKTRNGELVKVLIVHGDSDNIVPYEEAHKMQKLVPQAELVTIEGAGHYFVFQEGHWQKIAASMATFFE